MKSAACNSASLWRWGAVGLLLALGGLLFWRARQPNSQRAAIPRETLTTKVSRIQLRERTAPVRADSKADATSAEALQLQVEPPFTLRQRPAEEWQGMLIEVGAEPPCLEGATCGWIRTRPASGRRRPRLQARQQRQQLNAAAESCLMTSASELAHSRSSGTKQRRECAPEQSDALTRLLGDRA
jgi:hypothetical protein